MAVSDVLFDAMTDMRKWREEFPDMYDSNPKVAAVLDELVAHMDAVRGVFDSCPSEAPARLKAVLKRWPSPPK